MICHLWCFCKDLSPQIWCSSAEQLRYTYRRAPSISPSLRPSPTAHFFTDTSPVIWCRKSCTGQSFQLHALCTMSFPVPYFNVFQAWVLIPSLFTCSALVSFPSIFQPFPPSPTGGRRKWKEDVEESGLALLGAGENPPLRRKEDRNHCHCRCLGLWQPSYPLAISVLASWKLSKTPHVASVLAETRCVKAVVRTVTFNFGFQCLEGFWWNRQSYQVLIFQEWCLCIIPEELHFSLNFIA